MKKILKHIARNIISRILILESRIVLRKYRPQIIVVTGTVGKTSTKDALYAVFSSFTSVRRSDKSFNSEIGVPLTILNLPNAWGSLFGWVKNILRGLVLIFSHQPYPRWLIIEVGTDKPGDVSGIANWLVPDVVVATRFAEIPVHVENFKNPEDVIKEEQSIAFSLKKDGMLVVNNDDPLSVKLRDNLEVNGVSFGMSEKAGIYATHIELLENTDRPIGMRFRVNYKDASVPITINGALGVQHIYPVIAAIATGISQGVNLVKIGRVFDSYETPRGRMRIIEGKNNTTLIDDTYNSSPVAAEQALVTLKQIHAKGRKIVVLGDMKELGRFSNGYHLNAGKQMKNAGVDRLFTIGEMGTHLANGFQGLAEHFSNKEKLISRILEISVESEADINLLVKGSRVMRLEVVVNALAISEENQ